MTPHSPHTETPPTELLAKDRPSQHPALVGVDVGKKHDPTAIVAAELQERSDGSHFVVRFLERLPLGTPYPDVAQRLNTLCRNVTARTGVEPILYLDATGVGQGVLDLLQAQTLGAELWAVTFVPGMGRTVRPQERTVSLGKARLVCNLQAVLQSNRLHLPRGGEADALVQELLHYEIRIDEEGRERYGAFGQDRHDDLATALGLAVQHVQPRRRRLDDVS